MRIVVADTGPVLHLHEAGWLWLPEHLGEIHIPDAGHVELARLIPGWEDLYPSWLARIQLSDELRERSEERSLAGRVDLGEAQAIILAWSITADW